MSRVFRTPAGGLVDRARVIRFEFDGQGFTGLLGDTLASALLANGVHLVGRSFKYHRPRGILSAGTEEPNALVTVFRDASRYTPNLRATQVELYEGLRAESQNRWPSLRFDLGAVTNWLAPLFPVGFYYKTFMWPRSAWRWLYEPRIRAAAGLGRAPLHPDPDRYTHRFAHCDVLVVGAGPAGLAATVAAARTGARVIVCDEQPAFGGSLLAQATPGGSETGRGWLRQALQSLTDSPNVMVLPRTTAFGYFAHNLVALNQRLTDHLSAVDPQQPRERLWQVRAKAVVLATGALERPLVFPGNDRPGCMLAGAARAYLNQYGVRVGTRAVLVTACDEGYRAALDLHAAGVTIALIADTRAHPDGELPAAARAVGITVQSRMTVLGTTGRLHISAVKLVQLTAGGGQDGPVTTVPCDVLLMSGGYTPSVHLFSQSRGKLAWSEDAQAFLPAQATERVRSAGACRGVFSLQSVKADGAEAGAAAAQDTALSGRPPAQPPPSADSSMRGYLGALPSLTGGGRGAFVDWQNDVTCEDLVLATREGFRSIEHVKRYTTTGMATDQGKTSNINALGIVAQQLQRPIPAVGLTTFRTPYSPVTFGSFAGLARAALFDPIRKTPLHDWAVRGGAVFEDVGLWKRARHFPRAGEGMEAAVARECLAVRNACGLFDASTLGKIEVVGKDAAAFMERMYVNSWSTLAVGRARYGLSLRDDGFIFDDGVVARTAIDRFHVTTTTTGAPRVLALMEDYLQTEWHDLSVWLTSTTEQWAVIALQGPHARRVLQGLTEDVDLSPGALPHMGVTQGRICGVPMLLCRVSFTGELGFEINVPADFATTVWQAVFEAGAAYGITVYGTEAMHVLRAEKGYIIVGQDTDGTVTPQDAGLAWMIGKDKADFVGKRSLQRPGMRATDRKQLVGLLALDPQVVLEEGAQIREGEAPPGRRPIGHVTSSYHSATLGRSIALAMVAGGRSRIGHTLHVPMPAGAVPVTVTPSVFYDPAGERLHG